MQKDGADMDWVTSIHQAIQYIEEQKKGYSMFERDKLDPADSMRIERNIYFEEQTADLSGLTALPLEQLQACLLYTSRCV